MKKTILKSFLTVAFGLSFFAAVIGFYSTKVSADTAEILYITTCVGEDETSIGINYHCTVDNSVVKYSTSITFPEESTFIATPTCTLWGKEQDSGDSKTGFAERYVCRANLTNLEENTQYYYKVVTDTKISATYKFVTYSSTGTQANILFATDIHSAGGSYTPTRPNTMMTNVRSNVRNVNLLVMTGDQVDRGGYEAHWESYYEGMQVFKNMIVAAIPGNHEYYHTSGGEYVSPEFHNQFYNNPQNGPEERLNSSFYFKYGNALFIMLDIIDKKYSAEQKEWFGNVVENNPAQWIIVGTHANAITGGSYTTDAKWMANNWGSTFEKYQVDLVIGGHEHVYIRKDLALKNEKDSDLGVTYYVSPAAQHKQYAYKTTEGLDAYYNTNYKVNIISVGSKKLSVTLYDEAGKEAGYEFELTPKRSATVTTQKDSTLLKALTLDHDKENEDANITWNKTFYGNVKKVIVERTSEDTTREYDAYVASEKTTSVNIGPIYRDRDYKVKVTLLKTDGSTITKEFDIINLVQYNLNLELDGGILTSPEEWVTYLSGKVTKLPTPIKDGHVFQGWFENNDFSSEKLDRITYDVEGDKTYYAKWAKQFNITYNSNGGSISNNAPTQYLEGDEFSLEIPYHPTEIFKGWYTNPEFEGEPITGITKETNTDLTLYAKWAKQLSITYNTRGGDIPTDSITDFIEGDEFDLPIPTKEGDTFLGWYDNESLNGESISKISKNNHDNLELYAKWQSDILEIKPETPKKKCGKKSGLLVVELLSAAALLGIVLKRKK